MAVAHDGLLERVQLLAGLEERLSLLALSLETTYQRDVVAVNGRGPLVSAGSTRSSAHLGVSPQNHQLETTVGRDAPWSNTIQVEAVSSKTPPTRAELEASSTRPSWAEEDVLSLRARMHCSWLSAQGGVAP